MDHLSNGRHRAGLVSREYALLDGLEHVDLEHSRIADIAAAPTAVTIHLDVALLPEHPDFTTPRPGEEFDYRGARLTFDEVTDLTWTGQQHATGLNAYGEPVLGQVHTFRHGRGTFEITGEFGALTVRAFDCRLALLESVPAQGMRRRA